MTKTHWQTTALVVLLASSLAACAPAGRSAAPTSASPATDSLVDATWKKFKADSGYEISYPLEWYSIRDGLTSSHEVYFQGVKVLVPNDWFYYQEPRAVTYKISIAVRENVDDLSLDEAQSLLSGGAIIAYDPQLLAGQSIQNITLDGVSALRVDDLPAGPAGISTQIVAIRNHRIYEVLVEPHKLTGNQAEPFQTGAVVASSREWVDQMIATFGFAD